MLAPTEAAMLGYLNFLMSNSRNTTMPSFFAVKKEGVDERSDPQEAHTTKTPLTVSPAHLLTSFPRKKERLSLAICDTVIES